jgi:RNA polymerase sigma factor for flagellar operon FliA
VDAVRLTTSQCDLIEEHHAYATALAMRQLARAPSHADREEILSCAYLGLVQAVQRWEIYCEENGYDAESGIEQGYFRTYLTRRINGAVLDHMRSQDWVRRSSRSLLKRHGAGDVSDAEVSQRSGASIAQVRAARAEVALSPLRLDEETTSTEGSEGWSESRASRVLITADDEVEANAEIRQVLAVFARCVAELPDIEREVFIRRVWLQMDVAEVGADLGLRSAHVSAIYSSVCESISAVVLGEMMVLGFDRSGRIADHLMSAVA